MQGRESNNEKSRLKSVCRKILKSGIPVYLHTKSKIKENKNKQSRSRFKYK